MTLAGPIPKFKPDVQGIRMDDGLVDVLEVQSKRQSDNFMNNKVDAMRAALGDHAGVVEWVPIVAPAGILD